VHAESNYRVFFEKENGTHFVLRRGPDSDDSESVFGPDTFSACIQWVNTPDCGLETTGASGYKSVPQ
jgi:hypothetical protein